MDLVNKAWFMKYIPNNIDSLIFESEEIKKLVNNWINNKKIDGNILFYGPGGLGKSATAQLLIKTIVTSQNDLLKLSRSVKNVDDDLKPFLTKQITSSNQKIVYIEECDRLSSTAMDELKDGLMEKYQPKTIFIGCTNYPKRIPDPLLQRFTYKIPFNGTNKDGIFIRLKYILDTENAIYDENELKKFIENNLRVGIRELINQLQNSYIANDKHINFKTISHGSGLEEVIITLVINILKVIPTLDVRSKRMCIDNVKQSSIAEDYKKLYTILNNNIYEIDYDIIYRRIIELSNFEPIKIITARYAESHEFKKFHHINMISWVYEIIKCMIELNKY